MNDVFCPRPLRRPGIARREAILKAAADVFAEHGYERASLAEINARAGGSKAFIYEQFGDKAGLFRAVMTGSCNDLLTPIVGDTAKGRAPAEVLRELGQQFLQLILTEDNLATVRMIYAEGPRHPDVADSFFAQHEEGFAALARFLGTFSDLPEERLVRLAGVFFFMVRGDAFDRKFAGCSKQRTPAELDEQVDLSVNWLMARLGEEGN